MADNIIRFPSSFQPDPNDPNNRHLFDALNARETDVSIMHPLELWMDRQFLLDEVRLSLQSLRDNFNETSATDVERNYFAAMVQQRVEFIEELNREQGERVNVAIYPMSSVPDVDLDEDLGDLDSDEPGDLLL